MTSKLSDLLKAFEYAVVDSETNNKDLINLMVDLLIDDEEWFNSNLSSNDRSKLKEALN